MNSVSALLSELNVPFADSSHHHVRDGWIGIDCPMCSPGWRKYRLGINLSNGRASCWNCGPSNAPKMIAQSAGVPLGKVLNLWADLRFAHKSKKVEIDRSLVMPAGVGPLQEAHIRYLRSRGFDENTITDTWGVKGIGIAAKLSWRLFIPIFEPKGTMVAWTTRSLNPEAQVRYITSAEEQSVADVKTLLYGEHLAVDSVVVVEGPIDAWAIGPGGLSTLGVAYTDQQVARVVKYPRRFVCFDSSPDAQKRANVLCRQLAAFPGETTNVKLETGKDPAAADPSEIEEIRKMAGLIDR